MIIRSVTERRLLSVDELDAAVAARFGDTARRVAPAKPGRSFDVRPPGEPGYLIKLFGHGRTLTTDGTEPQALALVAWVRSLLPDDFPRVIVTDQGWGWHTELTAGITAEEILSRKVRHDEHWSDRELESS